MYYRIDVSTMELSSDSLFLTWHDGVYLKALGFML